MEDPSSEPGRGPAAGRVSQLSGYRRRWYGGRRCDPESQTLRGGCYLGIAAVGLLLFASFSWRARPKLAITPDGLVIRGWWHTRTARRGSVTSQSSASRSSGGIGPQGPAVGDRDRRGPAGEVFTRWDLGADPLGVLDVLTAAGYAGP